MDVALHPQFERNRLVYLTYTKPVGNGMGAPALARGRLEGHALVDVEDLLVPDFYEGNSGLNGRVVFGRDGKVYMSTGGRSQNDVANVAQDRMSLRGKILRLNDDGSVPADNPFVGREGHRPEIYTVGHRNTLGLIVHPTTGEIWQHENGPQGGDELNIILAGARLRLAGGELRPGLFGPTRVRASDPSRGSSRRSSSGCPPSRSPEWPSTPATGFRPGEGTCSSAG